MADWNTLLPEEQRKAVAEALLMRNSYDGIYRALLQDPESEEANTQFGIFEQNDRLDMLSGASRRSLAKQRRTDKGNELVAILEDSGKVGHTLNTIVNDAVNYIPTVSDPSKPDDERIAAETNYVLNLLGSVAIPSKENLSKPSIDAIGKPLAEYNKLTKAIQTQDYAAVTKVLQSDVPKKAKDADERIMLIGRIAAQDPESILREGAKRANAKLSEVAKAIIKKDNAGNMVEPYDTDIVREYLIKGLEAADPKVKAEVYAGFLNAAQKGLDNAGYKV